MTDKMANAPVYYALAQVQFNPVAMSKYADEIQDILRRQGYTLYDSQTVSQLQIAVAQGHAPTEPSITSTKTWTISKTDGRAGFILGSAALTYHTTHYETHDKFLSELLLGLEAVHKVVGLDHLSRLGLRYLNAVLPKEAETVEQYLASGVHGAPFKARRRYSLSESVFDTDSAPLVKTGTFIARTLRARHQLGFPPDLMTPNLELPEKLKDQSMVDHAIIDLDHFVEGRMPVEGTKVLEQLVSLHTTLKEVFRAIVTDHARAVWS
jgi:uncharacterized protein (TIGR04255 family)